MKRITIWMLIIILLAGLVGCTQQVLGPNEPVIGTVDQDNMPILTQDSGPAKGSRLNLFMTKPDSLNPLYTLNPYVRYVSQFLFDSLFTADGEKTCKNSLAESWQLSTDGLILDIKLRDGVMYHDGTSLSASDVAYTIDAVQKAQNRGVYGGNVENIDSTKTVDRLNIRLILRKADPDLLTKLTFPILPEHIFKDWPIEGYDPQQKPIGSGAYKFDSMNENTISLSRNENWWYAYAQDGLKHTAWMDGLDFKIYDNQNEMMPAFQKQEIDIAFVDEGNSNSYSNRKDILYNQYQGNTFECILLSTLGAENGRMSDAAFRTALLKYLGWYMALYPLTIGIPASEEYEEYGSSGNRVGKEDTIKAVTALGMVYDETKNILYYFRNGSKIPLTLNIKYNALDTDRLVSGEWVQKALGEIGIIATLGKSTENEEKNFVSNRKFDIMILGSRIPLYSNLDENIILLKQSLGFQEADAVLLPLYRKSEALLYNPKIKGPRLPIWKNIFNGWMEWYLVQAPAKP